MYKSPWIDVEDDGCSTTSGHKNGAAVTVKADQPRALYTHCYGHALNLAASDAVMQCAPK